MIVDTFIRCHVSKCLYLLLTIRVTQQVLSPCNRVSAIAPVEPIFVAREVAAAKLLIAADKMYRMELSRIRATPPTGVTRSPARIDQLPIAIVDLDYVPGMTRRVLGR